MKKAFITGITGQDGSYLAEFLLKKGYEVHGILRRSSSFNTGRIDPFFDKLHLYHGDMNDGASLRRVLQEVQPDEVYNLAAQSHVQVSFQTPEYTIDSIVLGTLRLLEVLKGMDNRPRMYQASSSEMYGVVDGFSNENTPFDPVSPYGIAKLAAHRLSQMYRGAYGVQVSCGILFNHESPRRGETFVTRKVCRAAVRIAAGLQARMEIGNLSAWRDWGFAGDYVEAMWLMLQAPPADDFVIATGIPHSVEYLCRLAFELVGLNYQDHIIVSDRLKRPIEVPYLLGDAQKAKLSLGWEPTVKFEELVTMMVKAEQEVLG